VAVTPTSPEDCYGTSLWGFGSWPFEGTDEDLKAWAFVNAFLPSSPITVPLTDPHPDHDAGLEPDPTAYHPTPSPTSATIDVTAAITEEEWDLLVAAGYLDASAPYQSVIQAEHLDLTWATAQMGVGYPVPVGSCPPHPEGSGYGGVGYGPQGEGETGYGLESYGAVWHAAPEMPILGGYGGDPYGFGSYGSGETIPPRLASAVSLNGWEIEVFFDEEMDPDDPELLDPTNYTLTNVGATGGPSTVTAVRIEQLGSVDITAGDFIAGVTSVIITHTGTCLGGTYTVAASNMTDIAGNPILGATVSLLTKGESPPYTVTPLGGGQLLLTFAQDMLESANYHPGAVDTIDDAVSYGFTSSPDYPLALTVSAVTHPYSGNLKQVLLNVVGQTSLTYTPSIVPAYVTNYGGTALPATIAGATVSSDPGVSLTQGISSGMLLLSQSGVGTSTVQFDDQTGRLIVGSTYRTDLTFDAQNSFNKPQLAVVTSIVTFQITDGAVEHTIHLGWDGGANLPLITLTTGGAVFTQTTTAFDWTDGPHTITMVRNQKADIVTFLFDETPIFSTNLANLGAPAVGWNPGTRVRTVTSVPVPTISNFKVDSLVTTASSTVFSGAWNFLHEHGANAFVGDATNAKDSVKVARGPLVKGWGDATPATKADVAVLVNGTEVEVADVNPYTGEITTVIPIPLMPIGQQDVKVDYQWMSSPIMEMTELNLEGLVLNKYDCTHGHHDPAWHRDAAWQQGAPDLSRFPMGIVLGPIDRPEPLFIGHRYMGFEQGYSALLNSPNTLLLNQHPNRSILPNMEQRPEGETATYEGLVRPTADSPVWQLEGTDTGAIETDAKGATGIYKLVDANLDSYDASNPQAAFYWRDVNLTFPSTLYVVGRFRVDPDTVTYDGVFSGVGMGVHDNHHLYFMGCLLVNGVEHLGMLLDVTKPSLVTSWQLGPQAQLSLQSQNTATCLATQVPDDLKAGDRFQVFHGDGNTTDAHPQSGVYTLDSVVFQSDGTVTLTTTTDFPANWNLFGNKYPIAVFEAIWSTPEVSTTFRLTVDPDQRVAVLSTAGGTTSAITTLDGASAVLPQPGESSLLLPPPLDSQNGQVLWGSFSREAGSTSYWTFFRYGVVPDVTSIAGYEVVVEAEMNDLPENDPNHDWALLGNFGYSEIDSTADAMLLKETSADSVRNFIYGYGRTETWFDQEANFDLSAKFRVESGTGTQDAQVVVNDTMREVRLGTLLYATDGSSRFLVRVPQVSFVGLEHPEEQDGWSKLSFSGFDDPTVDIQEKSYIVTQGVEQKFGAQGTFLDSGLNFTDTSGRILEARFKVVEHTSAGDGFTGIKMAGSFDPALKNAGLHLYDGGVRVFTDINTTVQNYAFDWDDGEFHNYRLVLDAETGVVSLYIDDTIQLPTLASGAFLGGSSTSVMQFGQFAVDGTNADDLTVTSTVEWLSASWQAIPAITSDRTIGIYLGGDADDIDNWEIPRTDSSTASNSNLTGPVIQNMDWRNYIEVRLWRDPTWGVTVLRPDLPLPPYYTPETAGVPGTGFATQITEPSAGWINVEYRNLPRVPSTFGQVSFGAIRPDNITQQRWEWVRYRFFESASDDIKMPQGMVLNRYNVITSGELTQDKGHETVVVQTLDDRRVTLLPTHLYAERIWKVIEGSTVYTSDMFDFLPESQLIALKPDPEGVPRCFGVRTSGTTGQWAQKSKEFTDSTADFSTVEKGDLLKIHYGEAAGSYPITKVDAAAKKVWVKTAFKKDPSNGSDVWSISQVRVPVTVVFVPGKPVTNTYLLNQPLLDGITKLNEGTPPVPKSQVGTAIRQEAFGSQINHPDDLLNNDPDFVLNNPYRIVEFVEEDGVHYEDMEFYEVDNGGETDLISFPCEATGLSDQPGFLDQTAGQGDPIYEAGGAGAPLGGVGDSAGLTETGSYTGSVSGGSVMHFSGSLFWEGVGAMSNTIDDRVVHTVDQGGGMPGKFFFASGGDYRGPVLAGGVSNALGGELGPGTTLFYPTYPSRSPAQGGGKIYRRTEWVIKLREVGISVDEAGDVNGQALDETLAGVLSDNTPPSGPSDWLVNANGTPSGTGNGAVFAYLSGVGDFSRFGPFGGLASLNPAPDTGLLTFIEVPLTDGTTVSVTTTAGTEVFTAAAVPVGTNQFASAPAPGVALAAAINAHPVTSLFVEAVAGLDLSGREAVRLNALDPVVPVTNPISVATSHASRIRASGLDPNNNLTGGSKMTQGSLAAGGVFTLNAYGVHDSKLGMVAQGGSALPTGVPQLLTLVSA
jgi:hypothetical protein